MKNTLLTILLWLSANLAFGEEFSLIFFYSPKCMYCHMMAPQLQMLATKYQLRLIGNSIEEQFIEGFGENINDLNLFRQYKIYGMPVLVLHNQTTQNGAIVIRGALFGETLELKMQEITQALKQRSAIAT